MVQAKAELHYTTFEDGATFRELLDRHDMHYAGARQPATEFNGDPVSGVHVWCGEDVHMTTKCDPIDGEHLDDLACGDPGYASYVTVVGEVTAAEALFRDVVETAERIKGEFDPLTTEDGEIITSQEHYHPEPEVWSPPVEDDCDEDEYWYSAVLDENGGETFIREMAGHTVTFDMKGEEGDMTREVGPDGYVRFGEEYAGREVELDF